jgi:LAS superfamily LD-carboxypeptidase LdcB
MATGKQPLRRKLRLAVGKNKGIPARGLVIPKELEKYPRGEIPEEYLKKVKTGGKLYHHAADAFNNLYDHAISEGIKLRNIGDYRPKAQVEALFLQRYSLKDQGRKPQITRKYQGKTWYLKPGMAPSASPDTGSPHDVGVAIDLGEDKKGQLVPLTEKARLWLCTNAPAYGFTLQSLPYLDNGQANPEHEWWHWQWAK